MIYWIDTSAVFVQRVVLAVVKAPLRSFRSSLGESFFFRGPIENEKLQIKELCGDTTT